jgi:TetR/AcrR family transcriptional regulator, transcriptional repressor for nem operon
MAFRKESCMAYPPEHRERTRSRIIQAARGLFNRHGFELVSIDKIMAEAGLTRGGFYHHFRSKDELYTETVGSFATCNPFAQKVARARAPVTEPRKLAHMLIDLYLSDEVLDDISQHCPLYALPGDVARAGLSPQQAYTDLIRSMAGVFRAALAGARDAGRRSQAIVSLCVGGMVLARTTNDAQLRDSLRAAARHQALALLGADQA